MKRLLAFALVALLLFAADRLRPRVAAPSPPSSRSAGPWVALLGPLRPLIAELYRLRFDATRLEDDHFGQLDDAWTVLELRPDRVADFVGFGWYFLFDAPVRLVGTRARAASARAGHEILLHGQALHPDSAWLRFAEAIALDRIESIDPARLRDLALRPEESRPARALLRFDEAVARLAGADAALAEVIRVNAALHVERRLREPATPPALRLPARALGERLLAEGLLAPIGAASLRAALDQ